MTTNQKTLRLQMDPDARLAAAAGAVVRWLAEGTLADEPAVALQRAIVAACREAFEELTAAKPHLAVTFLRYADRIEVVFPRELSGALRLDRVAAAASSGVDRVQDETNEGQTVTRVIKYLGDGPQLA